MLLAMNVQNANITLGCFDESQLRIVAHISTETGQTADQYACQLDSVLRLYGCRASEIFGAVMCSVVPSLSGTLEQAVKLLFGCDMVNVSSGVKTGLSIEIDNPRLLGSDLVCLSVQAAALGRLPALVIDMNTATTFTALDQRGTLIGSAIAPGVRIGLDALHAHAAQLPSVSLTSHPCTLIGKNTIDAMTAGVLLGAASMVDGMIEKFRAALGDDLTVYLTGTDAAPVTPYLQQPVQCIDDMVLYGLHRIWTKNRKY